MSGGAWAQADKPQEARTDGSVCRGGFSRRNVRDGCRHHVDPGTDHGRGVLMGGITDCQVDVVGVPDNIGGLQAIRQWLLMASKTEWDMSVIDQTRAIYNMPDKFIWQDDEIEVMRLISAMIPQARITAICEGRKDERWVVYAHDGKVETHDEITDFPPSTLWAAPVSSTASPGLILSVRETGTILAALRMWQRRTQTEMPMVEYAIATDGGIHRPLSATEIDALCERINCGGE